MGIDFRTIECKGFGKVQEFYRIKNVEKIDYFHL